MQVSVRELAKDAEASGSWPEQEALTAIRAKRARGETVGKRAQRGCGLRGDRPAGAIVLEEQRRGEREKTHPSLSLLLPFYLLLVSSHWLNPTCSQRARE